MKSKRKYFLTLLNFLFLIINISFFTYKRAYFEFKNSDKYIFLNRRNFHIINFFKFFFNPYNSKEKIEISLICKDTLDDIGCSLEKLNYIVNLDNNLPDFLIYDVFGYEHTNSIYNNSIKLAFFSENIIPDFSEADYSIGQAHIIYLDRYYKYPSFIWNLEKLRNYEFENIGDFQKNLTKTKFCAAVISNHSNSTFFRLKFIEKLNNYKHVDMGGNYLNDFGKHIQDKIKFLSPYKFSISMENSNGDGYISEKIIDSLISGTIPIYYGDYLVDE